MVQATMQTSVCERGDIVIQVRLRQPAGQGGKSTVDHPACAVEHAVVAELGAIFRATEEFMLLRMQDVTLAAIAGQVRA